MGIGIYHLHFFVLKIPADLISFNPTGYASDMYVWLSECVGGVLVTTRNPFLEHSLLFNTLPRPCHHQTSIYTLMSLDLMWYYKLSLLVSGCELLMDRHWNFKVGFMIFHQITDFILQLLESVLLLQKKTCDIST